MRKSALYGKVHSAHGPSRKSAFCVWASPKGTLCTLCMRAVVAPRGHFRRSVYTPASLRLPATAQQRAQVPHSATGDSRKDALWGCHSHGKAHSGAHWLGRVRLSVRPDSKPRSANPRATRPAAWRGGLPHTSRAPRRDGKAHSARSGDHRVRFSVRRRLQNALFREAAPRLPR